MMKQPLHALIILLGLAGCRSPQSSEAGKWPPPLPVSAAAGPQQLWVANGDSMTSTWYLTIANEPVAVVLEGDPSTGSYEGRVTGADGRTSRLDNIVWNARTGTLGFRRIGVGYWQWILGRAVEGVLVGRVSVNPFSGDAPTGITAFTDHVSGWNDEYFSRDLVPRTFDLLIDRDLHARLRLDRDASGALIGRFKVYASESDGSAAEQIEYDVDVQQWDGRTLMLTRTDPSWQESYTLLVSGRGLSGTVDVTTTDAPQTLPVTGTREELLSFGLSEQGAAERDDWQQRVRRQLAHLMMADNPAPLTVAVTRNPGTISVSPGGYASDRDDAPDTHPRNYTVDEITLSATIPNAYGATRLVRTVHGYLGTPMTPPPAGGFPAIITLNGHGGSAQATFDPDDSLYWYADAWCRRGFVVLSIDMSHRPPADRGRLYSDFIDGDDPTSGNAAHPAIRMAPLDSDWQEDGERVWDVERAIDFLTTQGNVDLSRLVVTGLSMGAEVATFAGAIDPRIRMVLSAGFVPDLAVMSWHGNHPCWMWTNAMPRDYFGVADLHALLAPRPLLAEFGTQDDSFSDFDPPYVSAKEVTRRSRTAYASAPQNFIFYLHDDQHAYHFGDALADSDDPPVYMTTPALTGPQSSDDLTWAFDGTMQNLGVTVVDQVLSMLPPSQP